MPAIPTLIRILLVVIALGLATGSAGTASAERGDAPSNQLIGSDTLADDGDLVAQLVQVLIDILNELLNGDGDLEDLLPAGCNVEVGGFSCDTDSGEANLFLADACTISIFDDDVYVCTVADIIYTCNIYGPTTILICTAP